MKTLAQFITELQLIPNPEKVGIAIYVEQEEYTPMSDTFPLDKLGGLDNLSQIGARKANDAQITSFILI